VLCTHRFLPPFSFVGQHHNPTGLQSTTGSRTSAGAPSRPQSLPGLKLLSMVALLRQAAYSIGYYVGNDNCPHPVLIRRPLLAVAELLP